MAKDIVREIELALIELVKDEIIKQDLIDTGRMLNSVNAFLNIQGNSWTVDVTSTDYFKYVDGDFKVLQNAFKGPKYDKVVKKINELLNEYNFKLNTKNNNIYNSMNKKEAIEKIKQFFSTEDKVEVKLMEVTTKDGVILNVLEDGSVMIGEEVAPDGEYILEDESVIIVKEGKKVEIEEVVVEEEMKEEVKEEVMEDEVPVVSNEELIGRIESLENALAQLLTLIEETKTEMSSQIKVLSNEPAEEEVKIKKSFSKSNDEKVSILEKYAQLRKK